MLFRNFRILISLLIGAAATFGVNQWVSDIPLGISAFQVGFLISLLTLDFDWKLLIAYRKLKSKYDELENSSGTLFIPPLKLENERFAIVPVNAILKDQQIDKFVDVSKALIESKKYGSTLDDNFQKMTYIALFAGAIIAFIKYAEVHLAKQVSPSLEAEHLSLTLNALKTVMALVPLCIQMSLVWGTCLYLRKKNIDLSL